ncbi:hypothetical protein GCM10017044_06040 [Kordiimonas sediminis]|uniref:Beta-lactamase-related domain-containing protein n=1 Tax=Kordiimonas sediminis TaxID=1735581 RepID=A0A919AMD7_9PROT|nr:serine hydrolase domain-containing protein [Kordiimonas sediminis]GHF14731.1 hypothetical protein GCM10017044_06040 [Kordiimonas sediminis]
MKSVLKYLLVSLTVLLPLRVSADDFPQTKVTNLIQAEIEKFDVQGMALAVVSKDQVLYEETFGVKNMYTKEPVTSQSLFHMASVSKTFVATALMQLHEAGKLDVDKPVVDYVPYFVLVDGRYKDLTVRQFASHITGMPDFDSDPWHDPDYDEEALERFVRDFISHKFLTHAPETKYQYCNTGYELLGDVIAKVSGMTFEQYVQDNILAPLGMEQSTFLIRDADMAKLNSLHILKDGKRRVADVYPYNRMHGPSSTLISSLADMIPYVQMKLNGGRHGSEVLLDEDLLNDMYAPAMGKFENVGFGWHRGVQKGQTIIRHGGNDGFKAYVAFIPALDIGFVMMSNTAEMSYHGFAEKVLDILIDHKVH